MNNFLQSTDTDVTPAPFGLGCMRSFTPSELAISQRGTVSGSPTSGGGTVIDTDD